MQTFDLSTTLNGGDCSLQKENWNKLDKLDMKKNVKNKKWCKNQI